ncbi:MAG: rRNA (cytidine-2'-O-)-methyltransferase, partial [Nitrospirae bacterium]|nr:rRNA (cytidine-2'-O-)-methyltransferase [Nitrospirota bacterium]
GLPCDAFLFVGPLPQRSSARCALLRTLRTERRTVVCFESPQRLPSTLQALRAELGNRRIAIACNLTTPREQWIRGTIDEIIRARTLFAIKGEVTLVVEGARRLVRKKRKPTSR